MAIFAPSTIKENAHDAYRSGIPAANGRSPKIEHTYNRARHHALRSRSGLWCRPDGREPASVRLRRPVTGACRRWRWCWAYPGFWISDPRTGANWKKVLHGEQALEIFKPLPTAATVIGRFSRHRPVSTRARTRGAVMVVGAGRHRQIQRRPALPLDVDQHAARRRRAFGGPSGPLPAPHPLPDRVPDLTATIATLPQGRADLPSVRRGDYNPLHADPAVALSGRVSKSQYCTVSARSAWSAGPCWMRSAATIRQKLRKMQGAPSARRSFQGRTIVTEIWKEAGGVVSFRAQSEAA